MNARLGLARLHRDYRSFGSRSLRGLCRHRIEDRICRAWPPAPSYRAVHATGPVQPLLPATQVCEARTRLSIDRRRALGGDGGCRVLWTRGGFLSAATLCPTFSGCNAAKIMSLMTVMTAGARTSPANALPRNMSRQGTRWKISGCCSLKSAASGRDEDPGRCVGTARLETV